MAEMGMEGITSKLLLVLWRGYVCCDLACMRYPGLGVVKRSSSESLGIKVSVYLILYFQLLFPSKSSIISSSRNYDVRYPVIGFVRLPYVTKLQLHELVLAA